MTLSVNTSLIPGVNIVTDSVTGGIALDYSSYYERMALAIERIKENTDRTANSLEPSDSTKLADNLITHLEMIAEATQIIKALAETSGIKTVNDYDILNFISTFKFLIESKELLKENEPLTDKESDKTNKRLLDYIRRIKNLPKE
jgi:hypothetical protein